MLGWPLLRRSSAGAAVAPCACRSRPSPAALVATILIYRIATREGRTDVATLLLAGVAINAMAAACIGLLIFLSSENELRDLNFWMLGSLNGVTWGRLVVVGPLILAAAVALTALLRATSTPCCWARPRRGISASMSSAPSAG